MTAVERRQHSRQLLKEFQAGTPGAFDSFYALQYPRMLRFGLTIHPEFEEVRDQVQNIFVYVFEHARRMSRLKDPESYLLAAVRNRLRKSLARNRITATSAEDLQRILPAEPSFVDALFADEKEKERSLALARQIAKLPPRQQQVIYLRFFEERSYEDIARIMDTKVGVVRNFVYRGLMRIRANPEELQQALLLLFSLGAYV